MIEFRLLEPGEIRWDALDAFDDRVVFQTREWLNFVAESQNAAPVVAKRNSRRLIATRPPRSERCSERRGRPEAARRRPPV